MEKPTLTLQNVWLLYLNLSYKIIQNSNAQQTTFHRHHTTEFTNPPPSCIHMCLKKSLPLQHLRLPPVQAPAGLSPGLLIIVNSSFLEICYPSQCYKGPGIPNQWKTPSIRWTKHNAFLPTSTLPTLQSDMHIVFFSTGAASWLFSGAAGPTSKCKHT